MSNPGMTMAETEVGATSLTYIQIPISPSRAPRPDSRRAVSTWLPQNRPKRPERAPRHPHPPLAHLADQPPEPLRHRLSKRLIHSRANPRLTLMTKISGHRRGPSPKQNLRLVPAGKASPLGRVKGRAKSRRILRM